MGTRSLSLTIAALAVLAAPLSAQTDHAEHAAEPGLIADLMRDVAIARQKLASLAGAIPAEKWDWRPGDGVRSVAEVYMHIAADNYFIPSATGIAAPASTGIRPDSYQSVQTYEKRKLDKQAIIAELEASFDHLNAAMQGTDAASLDEMLTVFGQEFTRRQLWITATTHVHEHLGQMIAYARTNGVVPPWSQ